MSPLLHRRLSDESLGSRLASGEAAAFDELYRRYAHRLAAYGAHLLGDAASGDDVAQAALMKAYGALRAGRVPDRLRPWLYRIAHNAAIDLVARRRELPAAELPDVAAGEPPEDAGALVGALAGLPDRQRRVYVLREIHGLRIDETAAELGLTAPQVEQALFAARNRLAELLVFGERLSCVAVRRLAAGPLDGAERRALKTHLRSCAGCRAATGRRGIALTLLPSLEWLRGLAGLGAAPAAKVGAAVATLTVAASVPGAVPETRRALRPEPRPPRIDLPATAARRVAPRPVAVPVGHAPVQRQDHAATVDVARTRARESERHDGRAEPVEAEPESVERGDRHGGGGVAPASSSGSGDSGESGGDRSGRDGGTVTVTAPATVPSTTTTIEESHDGGSLSSGPGDAFETRTSGDSSRDGGSGSGDDGRDGGDDHELTTTSSSGHGG